MSSPRRRRNTARPTPRSRPAPARAFWGPDTAEVGSDAVIAHCDHATALIHSLGPPPFPGGGIAQHYFDAVYERATALAVALAASAGLSEPDDAE